VRTDLLREFPDQSEDRVEELLVVLSGELLEHARFDDFVPVLVHSRARAQLAGGSTSPPDRHATFTGPPVPVPG
jgi:hypothetical protein